MSLSAVDTKQRLRGVSVGLLIPFEESGKILYEQLAANAKELYARGVRSFLSTANISEYHSLSRRERVDVADACVNSLPNDACVLAGVGGSTGDARELIYSYDDIGVDGMMIMPPDHTYVHEQGLIEYYRKLGAVTGTPLVPYIRGFDPSVEFLAELTRLDDVVAIKYAIDDVVKLGAAVEAGADDVVWVNGMAEPMAVSTWAEGIEGFSAGVSNFRPEVGLALYEALANENWARARELRNVCLPFQRFRTETGQNNTIPEAVSVPAVKKGLELAGLHGGAVREPIQQLSPAEEARAEELYEQLDDDINRVLS